MSRKQEHSRKPDAMYDLIEKCSPGPFLELFARERVEGWIQGGDELDTYEQAVIPSLERLALDHGG
jgi:N6-adenosine-specific RNA methylase IME4